MLKDLIVNKNTINIDDINENTSCIILCYRNNKPCGHVCYINEIWHYVQSLSVDDYVVFSDHLVELLNNLTEDYNVSSFKVIEFE